MYKRILFILCVFLVACSTTKKAATINSEGQKNITCIDSLVSSVKVSVDTSKQATQEITYTKVEFYPVQEGVTVKHEEKGDTVINLENCPNWCAIKSIVTWTSKTGLQNKGETKVNSVNTVADKTTIQTSDKKQEKVKEVPVANKNLKYLFLIGILLVGTFLYVKRKFVIGGVKNLVKKIAGIF